MLHLVRPISGDGFSAGGGGWRAWSAERRVGSKELRAESDERITEFFEQTICVFLSDFFPCVPLDASLVAPEVVSGAKSSAGSRN